MMSTNCFRTIAFKLTAGMLAGVDIWLRLCLQFDYIDMIIPKIAMSKNKLIIFEIRS